MAKFCPYCGKKLEDGTSFCPDCGSGASKKAGADTYLASILVNRKNVGVALIFSILIPGLGHLYLDKPANGALLLILFIVTLVLLLVSVFALVLSAVVIVYSVWDSWKLAKEYNRYILTHDGQAPW